MKKNIAHDIIALNRKSYQTIAANFSQTRHQAWDDFRWMDQYVEEGMRVLDIGCGNGRLFEYLVSKSIAYTGIDMSTHMIQIANTRYSDHLLRPTFTDIDILDTKKMDALGEYDLVVGVAVLCHIPQPLHREALDIMARHLKKGGTLILYNWHLWRPTIKQKSAWKAMKEKIMIPKSEWQTQIGLKKSLFGPRDVITWWQGNGVDKVPLYYYAFTVRSLKTLFRKHRLLISEACYLDRGVSVPWYRGKNIVVIGKKP